LTFGQSACVNYQRGVGKPCQTNDDCFTGRCVSLVCLEGTAPSTGGLELIDATAPVVDASGGG
jgi:hypothetical protein